MKLRKDFKDVAIVNHTGGIEYISVMHPDFFGFRPEELVGKKFTQVYTNIDEESSTFMRAINYGERYMDYTQTLELLDGRRLSQAEDIYLIRNGEDVVGAIEFARYDEKTYLLKPDKIKNNSDSDESFCLENIIGSCPEIREIKRKVSKIVDRDSSVLIIGETGTGKELTARVIHAESNRKAYPFVYVNCSALPESLLEGLLFGIKKGSFTDAEEKDGLFKLADKGTLFLDEVDSMPMGIQAKILKVIEEKAIRPIGASEEIYLDVRIIAACSGNLDELLRTKKIRSDLFFRLSVIQFTLPPLRSRGEDVLEIADYYIRRFNGTFHRNVEGFSAEARKLMLSHYWQGNVREVKNLLEGFFCSRNKSVIEEEDVRYYLDMGCKLIRTEREIDRQIIDDFAGSGCSLKEYLERKEVSRIREVLDREKGNIVSAARSLGISPQLLRYKVKNL